MSSISPGNADGFDAAGVSLAAARTAGPPAASSPPGLLERVVEAAEAGVGEAPAAPAARATAGLLDAFLAEPSTGKALVRWFGPETLRREASSRDRIARRLGEAIARIDTLLAEQVDAILHHQAFQRLEASWRGLKYLVEQADAPENVKIRVLNVSWQELARDAERAIEFDQSQLFRKVYSDEFGTPGGEPFGVLLGDYQVHLRPSAEHPIDDLEVLRSVSQVAAAAFAPFIAGAHPSLLGVENFTDLEQPLNLRRGFEQLDYLKWRAFRETEDARFVGLALPRVLMRPPYEDRGTRADGFRYAEDVAGPDRSAYLWGNAAYAFGAVLVRAFATTGWLADIRGVQRGLENGGLVSGLPVHCFSTEKWGLAAKSSTEVILTDRQEPELSDLGFMPLCHVKDTEYSAFYAAQSVAKAKKYDDPAATANARISSMLQYMLCVCRFAHYLKVIARDKIGGLAEPEALEDFLHRWLQNYVTSDSEAGPETKSKYPLREAKLRVREQPGRPGGYLCVAHLWPHYQLDQLVGALRLTTELTPGRPS
jgi:type VI secretion system ImpC/EvpB family protein